MNKSKSDMFMNKVFTFIGKIVVFTGAFCGLFMLLSTMFSFAEPYVLTASRFCISNMKYILIGFFAVVFIAYLVVKALDEYSSKGVSNKRVRKNFNK